MTTIVAANEAMAQKFVDTWTPTGLDFALENEAYKPGDEPWARYTSRISGSTQDTLGKDGCRRFERTGSLFVQIYDLVDKGTARSKELAQTVVGRLEGQRITGTTIRFNDVIPRETGPDGKWYQTTVEINFVFDETK